ncbi:MAG: hypothetical protein JO142_10025 [Burkholderiales bacterium]|nr:hypothetical protein [Burkholderiales bacterium]
MKQNLIARSAVAAAFGLAGATAMAGSLAINTATIYAKQAFVSATSAVSPSTAFTYTTGGVLAPNTTVYLYFSPSAGTFNTTATNAQLKANTSVFNASLWSVSDVALTANGVVVATLATNSVNSVPAGTPIVFNVPGVTAGAAFNTTGAASVLGVSGSGTLSLNAEIAQSNAATPPALAIDSATASLATSVNAVTLSAAAGTGASISSTNSTQIVGANQQVVLGSITFAGNAASQHVNLTGVNVTAGSGSAANNYNSTLVNFTLTGAFANNTSVFLSASNLCNPAAANLIAGSAVNVNAANTSVAVSYALNSSDASYTAANDTFTQYICYNVAAANSAIPAANFAISGVVNAVGSASLASVTTPGIALASVGFQGASVNLSSYIPGNTPGWTGYVRLVNSNTTQPITVTANLYNAAGAAINTTPFTVATLQPNSSTTLTTAAIETAAGLTLPAAAPGNWFRMVLTGTTSGLQARSLAYNQATSAIYDMTSTASGTSNQ